MTLPLTHDSVTVYCKIVKLEAKRIGVTNGTKALPLDGLDKTFWLPRDKIEFSKVGGWVKMPRELAKLSGLV